MIKGLAVHPQLTRQHRAVAAFVQPNVENNNQADSEDDDDDDDYVIVLDDSDAE